ncbi:hypothetical protein [Streptomyces sp. NPDC018031]|uniref:hypothetical protein n=1 Tax=Streptomyces sp. NPDC018031 TaxID=3365033 RepID=UPI00379ECDBF
MAVPQDPSTLPAGATGFLRPGSGTPPETDPRAFRGALYAAARAAGGRVGEVVEREYPRTFHLATVVHGGAESVVLCHAHHPWVAFAAERREWYRDEFLPAPPWSGPFAAAGFAVLGAERLTVDLAGLDTSVLSPQERRQIRLYRTDTLGGALFNCWD